MFAMFLDHRRLLLAAACLPAATGCTTALTTAALRETLWQFSEHASETTPEDATKSATAAAESADSATTALDADRRAAAIEEAVGRLSRAGTLDTVTRQVLVDTLERTQPEDWPVVIETFAESLPADPVTTAVPPPAKEPPRAGTEQAGTAVIPAPAVEVAPTSSPGPASSPAPEPHTVAKAPVAAQPAPGPQRLEPVGPTPSPAAPAPSEPAAGTAEGTSAASPAAPPAPLPAAVATPAALAIRNACFASRVQAWGVVDRFPESRFRPGQEVIVYFELDHLESRAAAAGHTTCIDTSLRLLDAGGVQLHAWSFEPIAETCVSRRRDYFARYVLRIPGPVAAGPATIEIGVRDTLGGGTATATLPLVVAAD